MKKCFMVGMALAVAATAHAAPNVTNVSQKGSLLVFPDIRVDDGWNTLIRIENDNSRKVQVKCYWMDGNKNRVDFQFPLTANQPFWFDARSGNGTLHINPFPFTTSNGFDNPFLVTPGAADEGSDNAGAYTRGMLACWVVRYIDVDGGGNDVDPDPCGCAPPDGGQQDIGLTQVKYNHLSGTATVYNADLGAYEYNAYAFFVQNGLELEPVLNSEPGVLRLNATQYDQCPEYLIGQFTPVGTPNMPNRPRIGVQRLAVASCRLDLRQDWIPTFTKLKFDVWNEDEAKFGSAYECADSWHETEFNETFSATAGGFIDAAAQNFRYATLQTYAARYRVRGVESDRCPVEEGRIANVGLLGVQSQQITNPAGTVVRDYVGSSLAVAGKMNGVIRWDPPFDGGVVPEGGIR